MKLTTAINQASMVLLVGASACAGKKNDLLPDQGVSATRAYVEGRPALASALPQRSWELANY
jgi:hypothetical protein